MIQELIIRDLAIIDKLDVDFQEKMTVLTGETGAGKSIIIDALGLLAGGRGSSEFIRKGANKTSLQGLFIVPKHAITNRILEQVGIELEDDTLILQRDIQRNGRNICRINGVLVNLATLRQVGETLIDIHGQNEHQELMKAEQHLHLLDEYDHNLQILKQDYQQAYRKYKNLKQVIAKRQADEQAWAQRLDMLQFQVQEISEAQLKASEENELMQEKSRLDNYQAIYGALEGSYQLLNGEEADFLGALGKAMHELEKVNELAPEIQGVYEKIAGAYYELQDAARDVSSQLANLEWDENRLNALEQRLELLHQLKRKYGDSIPEVLEYLAKIKQELDEMRLSENDSDQQKEELCKAKEKAQTLAQRLSSKRKEVANKLEQAIQAQLKALYMDKAVFKVNFEQLAALNENGCDKVEFYLQTNPGEAMGSLVKIASGGELSRIMLALKTIFAQNQGVTSIIFDEVDTGVSGRVAQAIAEKISSVAQNSQVLCITHLPQVAAISDNHYFIAKHVINGRTETTLTKLDKQQRIDELARMLSGSEITQLTRQHAKELLELATKQ